MKKLTATFIILFVTLNGIGLKLGAHQNELNDILSVLKSQPVLEYYNSATLIPIKIVNKLFFQNRQ